jgi:general secretion pathway protein G
MAKASDNARKFRTASTDRRQSPAPPGGFTLIELMIVLTAIAILAVIVIPRFSDASEEARESALAKDLRTVRSQIELFKFQHGGILPGQGGRDIVAQLTGKTDAQGNVTADGAYGPYMSVFPTHPFTNTNTVRSAAGGAPGNGAAAWSYNTKTGEFFPNDLAHKDM